MTPSPQATTTLRVVGVDRPLPQAAVNCQTLHTTTHTPPRPQHTPPPHGRCPPPCPPRTDEKARCEEREDVADRVERAKGGVVARVEGEGGDEGEEDADAEAEQEALEALLDGQLAARARVLRKVRARRREAEQHLAARARAAQRGGAAAPPRPRGQELIHPLRAARTSYTASRSGGCSRREQTQATDEAARVAFAHELLPVSARRGKRAWSSTSAFAPIACGTRAQSCSAQLTPS